MAHELTAYAAEINDLRRRFNACDTCSYKWRGMRRLADAELFLASDTDYALALIDHARAYLTYAKEFTFVQNLRREALARTGLEEV